MSNLRAIVLSLMALTPAAAQSVVSTHSGVVYFFAGSVYIGNERLEQKFGRFPDIGEGRELRTETGRAEVLLTPGVVLRVSENSSLRMLSDKLSDTRVELLTGSAILESNDTASGTAVTVVYKRWQVQAPHQSVYRIDAEPAQVHVYKSEAQVSASAGDPVTVKEGEVLPLADVLVTEQSQAPDGDSFKSWAMNRSQAVAADNATAAGIIDDPSQLDSSGIAQGGFSYFPLTGMPSLGIGNPYGLSFWSSYQSTLNAIWIPSYLYLPSGYGLGYRGLHSVGWPVANHGLSPIYSPYGPRPIGLPLHNGGLRPGGLITTPHTYGPPRTYTPPHTYAPAPGAVHAVGGHR